MVQIFFLNTRIDELIEVRFIIEWIDKERPEERD